ncbi:unnamed protein product [Symbiodinium pilosum]|uniref:Uncharacterized protein n=1 Tax=Symbiodinium pilosum TaxID=2952 RepID=A0A812W479_SYMPI|nr:unnamed protein product [Symbiodinium pilosum]
MAHADSEDRRGIALGRAPQTKHLPRAQRPGPRELGGAQLPAHPCAPPESPRTSCFAPELSQRVGTALVGPVGRGLAHNRDWGRQGPAVGASPRPGRLRGASHRIREITYLIVDMRALPKSERTPSFFARCRVRSAPPLLARVPLPVSSGGRLTINTDFWLLVRRRVPGLRLQRHPSVDTFLRRDLIPTLDAKLAQLDCFEHGWVGDPALDPSERGLVVLGVPIGSPDFVRRHLRFTLERQASLLDQLPALEDAQVAWLLLSFCAAPRMQYALRTVPPLLTEEFAAGHVPTLTPCHLSLLLGLSLRSGTAAWVYWASWADSLQLFARREPAFAERLSASLAGSDSLPLALDSLRLAGHSLSAASFELPTWQDLSRMPPPQQHDDDPGADVTRGWQRSASRALDDFGDRALRRELDPTSAAMLDSRAGPYGALPPVAPF